MDYNGWVTAVCAELEYQLPITQGSANPTGFLPFDSLIPNAIDYTENRIQRDLDIIGNITTVATGTMTANTRFQTLPAPNAGGIYVVTTQIRPIINNVRQTPLEPVSRDFIDYAWPDENSLTDVNGAAVLPVQWAPDNQARIVVGPAPATTLGFEVVGTARVLQLSPTNLTNFLSVNFPDIYLACSMVFWSGYQGMFGAQSDDPKMAQSWENQYQLLKSGADVEEARKRFANMVPSPSNPNQLQAAG
jgi:hypothetical protein